MILIQSFIFSTNCDYEAEIHSRCYSSLYMDTHIHTYMQFRVTNPPTWLFLEGGGNWKTWVQHEVSPRKHVSSLFHLITREVVFHIWLVNPCLYVHYLFAIIIWYWRAVNFIWKEAKRTDDEENRRVMSNILIHVFFFIYINSTHLCRIPPHRQCWRRASHPCRVYPLGHCCSHACGENHRARVKPNACTKTCTHPGATNKKHLIRKFSGCAHFQMAAAQNHI